MRHTQLRDMFSQKVLGTVSSSLITQHLVVVVVVAQAVGLETFRCCCQVQEMSAELRYLPTLLFLRFVFFFMKIVYVTPPEHFRKALIMADRADLAILCFVYHRNLMH